MRDKLRDCLERAALTALSDEAMKHSIIEWQVIKLMKEFPQLRDNTQQRKG
jgi:hypothetical protein